MQYLQWPVQIIGIQLFEVGRVLRGVEDQQGEHTTSAIYGSGVMLTDNEDWKTHDITIK